MLSGVVRFAGAPPKLDPMPVHRNREVCGEQKASEALVVGSDRGVRGSVVLIEGVARGKKATAELLLDNRRCLFVPHVHAMAVGDKGGRPLYDEPRTITRDVTIAPRGAATVEFELK